MSFSRLSILKLIELALAIVIVWLHYDTYEANGAAHLFIITATFAGFLIVLLGTFLGSVSGGINKNVDMFYCVLGAALFIASGALSIQHFNGWTFRSEVANKGLTKGSLAIIEGAIFLVDAFFVFKA